MSLLILKPISERVNYLVLAALGQRSFPWSERRSREIMLPADSSPPQRNKVRFEPTIASYSLHIYNQICHSPSPRKGWRGENQRCHIWSVPSTLKETSREGKKHSQPPNVLLATYLAQTLGARDWWLLMPPLIFLVGEKGSPSDFVELV